MGLEVVAATPVSAKGLVVSLSDVKTALGITDGAYDAYLTGVLTRGSSLLEGELGIPPSDGGSTSLGFASFKETFFINRGRGTTDLVLSRRPVVSVAKIEVDGDEIDEDQYRVDLRTGIVSFGACSGSLVGAEIAVYFDAGWVLPGDANPNVPAALSDAIIWFAKANYSAKDRDPLAKSITITDVKKTDYWVGSINSSSGGSAGPFPSDIAASLYQYRYEPV